MVQATGRDTSAGLGTFDLGDDREVRVWRQPHFGDPSSLWFEVARGGELLRPPYCQGTAGRGWYDVTTVWTADRAVSCTYSARDPFTFAIYCDWATGDVWPSGDDAKWPKWQAAYQQLRKSNPDMPPDRTLEPVEIGQPQRGDR
jgi:hypothetical protein